MTLFIILLTLLGAIAILQGMRINYLETHYVSAEDLLALLQSFYDALDEKDECPTPVAWDLPIIDEEDENIS